MADLNLTNNYSSLIGQFDPGKSPFGGPFGPGLLDVFYHQKNRGMQDQAKGLALNQAKEMADVQTGMIDEYNQAAPGRKDMIGFGNQQAEAMNKNAGVIIGAKLWESMKNSAESQKKFNDAVGSEADDLAFEYFTAAQSQGPEKAKQLIAQYKQLQPDTKIRGKAIKDMSDMELEIILTAKGASLNAKQKSATIGGEMVKGQTRRDVAGIAANASILNTLLRGESAKEIATMKENAKKSPQAFKTFEAYLANKISNAKANGASEEEVAQLEQEVAAMLSGIKAAPQVEGKREGAEQGRKTVKEITGGSRTPPKAGFIKEWTDSSGRKRKSQLVNDKEPHKAESWKDVN